MKITGNKLFQILFSSLFLMSLGGQGLRAAQPEKPAAEKPAAAQPAKPQAIKSESLGEDPGPVYNQVISQWVQVTNFAKNAATVATNKLKLDMQKDPKLEKIITPALIADLEQFFYELFISKETIDALSRVYAQYFTLDEMEELIKFYNSPVGQKLIKSNPDLMMKSQAIGMFLLKKHEREYMEVVAKYIAPHKTSNDTQNKKNETQNKKSEN